MSRNESRITAQDRVLTDVIRESIVDQTLHRTRRRRLLIALIVLILVPAAYLIWRFTRDAPTDYASIVDQFKYGSIGSEPGGSVADSIGGLLPPYEVFRVLPQVCADKLPGGFASLGLITEPGHDLPVGVSQRYRLGFEQVGLNCAVCHTGTVRDTASSTPRVVAGMPAHQLDLQGFFRFILDCSLSEEFTADNILGYMDRSGHGPHLINRLAYRYALIPRTREQTLVLQQRLALLMGHELPSWGPGRVDTFNPYKGLQFNWPLTRLPRMELIASSDFPSLWNQAPREHMQLHWDGNNDSLDERNLSASLGAGVTPVTVDHPRLERIRNWVRTLPPPPYPYPIDPALAERGRQVYATACLNCHADHRFKDGINAGKAVGTVDPIDSIATDPQRLHSYTEIFAANQYTLYPDSVYQFRHFRKTNGYANQPLDGIWARAPYLHNGSVPTLRDLLEPAEARPVTFYRGYDVYDPVKVGFVSTVGEERGRRYFAYDTTVTGNHNSGHAYGTTLPAADKTAIVEYLKTF